MSKLQPVRGTRDLLPSDTVKFRFTEQNAYRIAKKYGFGEIETPIFEFTEVFHRTLGETSDVVHKETYTFTDRSGDSLTLRPEGTAGVARAFISEGLAQQLPLKLYYAGPMFRHERPQKGRYRQFKQVGVEVLGIESPMADLETIALGYDFLCSIGLKGRLQLEINTLGDAVSRQNYREALIQYFSAFKSELSEDSQMRLEKNPLRILDSKNEGDRKLIAGAPSLQQHLTPESKEFFEQLLAGLRKLEIPFQINDRLVRGLDYYCHTVFEFTTTELGAQGTVLAGGRYDGLIDMMGGPRTPGVGWAAGVDRLVELIPPALLETSETLVALIGADDVGDLETHLVAQQLRAHLPENYRVENILNGKMGKRMQKAAKMNAKWALILGGNEVEQKQATVKNLLTGEQTVVSQKQLVEHLTKN